MPQCLSVRLLLTVCLLCVWMASAQEQRGPSSDVPSPSPDQDRLTSIIMKDETHCLTGPEIRGERDKPISCYCRDAIANTRYLWKNYLHPIPIEDANLFSIYAALLN